MLWTPHLWIPPEPDIAAALAMLSLIPATWLAAQPVATGGAGPIPTIRPSFQTDVCYQSGGSMMGGVGLPSSHTTNDILVYVACGVRPGDTPTFGTPTGYTQIFSDPQGQMGFAAWWKRDGGSETAKSISVSDGFAFAAGLVFCVTGCLTSGTPYEGLQQGFGAADPPDLTTTNTNRLLITFYAGGCLGPPSMGAVDSASSTWTKMSQSTIIDGDGTAGSGYCASAFVQRKDAASSGSWATPGKTLANATTWNSAALAFLPNPAS